MEDKDRIIEVLETRIEEMLSSDNFSAHWNDIVAGTNALAAYMTARAMPQTTINNYTIHPWSVSGASVDEVSRQIQESVKEVLSEITNSP